MIQCAYLEKVKLTIFQNIISNDNYMRNDRFPCMASISFRSIGFLVLCCMEWTKAKGSPVLISRLADLC